MGDWAITIRGTGAHHNGIWKKPVEGEVVGVKTPDEDRPVQSDADLMTKRFVKSLRDAGHTIHDAAFTHGAKEDFKPA